MSNFFTQIGNNLIVISGLFSIGWAVYWLRARNLSAENRRIVLAWQAKDIAMVARILWWSVAIAAVPDPCIPGITQDACTYNQWFVDHKHLVSLPAGIVYLMAEMTFIRAIDQFSLREKVAWILVGNLLAIGAAVAFAL